MAGPTQHKANPILYSSQEIDNESFNDTYKIKQSANYGYDSLSNSFKPSQADITYDYIAVTYPIATQEVYTYKAGGSGGTTTGTVTVTYIDSTKANIASVQRS